MKLLPGQRLSETDISAQLGVSRQPVREAFIKLNQNGLVEILPQRGTYVVKISVKLISDARFVRESVELAIIKKAIEIADNSFFEKIDHLLEKQREASIANDAEMFHKYDDAFHKCFAIEIDHEYAWHIVEQQKLRLDRVRFLSLPQADTMDPLINQHSMIVQAVKDRDLNAAEVALKSHLSRLNLVLPEIIRRHPDYFID
jgi:DNA-binding GntR family transcriptional regulator